MMSGSVSLQKSFITALNLMMLMATMLYIAAWKLLIKNIIRKVTVFITYQLTLLFFLLLHITSMHITSYINIKTHNNGLV